MFCQYWIVVANASHAAVYCVYPKKLHQKTDLVSERLHLQSRMKKSDLVTNAPRYSRGPTNERSVYEEHIDAKELEADRFAKEVARLLNENLKQLNFKYLMLAVSPHFYGLLNKYLNKQVKNSLKKIIKKDYSRLSAKGLEKAFFEEKSPRKADQRGAKQH